MDSRLKQRLIGAAVLVALAVIFLPMLVQGPAPDSGVSDVPLSMPDTPRGGYETRDLPLVTPGNAPAGGAVGMDSARPLPESSPAPPAGVPAINAPASSAPASSAVDASQPAPAGTDARVTAVPLPQASAAAAAAMLPAPTAGGDYAVSFGTFPTAVAADAVVLSLRAAKLPGYREATTSSGKPASRVRIGPYASRADAEAARLRAAHVRDDVGARVIALDAPVTSTTPAAAVRPVTAAAPTPTPAQPTAAKPSAAAPMPTAKPVDAPRTGATPAAPSTGFAIQLGAFSQPGDASALRDKLRAAGFTAFTESVATDKGTLTRVRVGPVLGRAEAEQLKAQVKARFGLDGIVRPHP